MHNIPIGQTIRERRKLLGLSQQHLADLAGVGLRTLINLEQEQGNPSLKILEKIANVLGLELTLRIRSLSE